MSTHKQKVVLKDFSKQTEQQYLSNKVMMEQGAKESTKQFRITTWMTVLAIILTVVNLVPTFINWDVNNYSEHSDDLTQIGNKIDEVTGLVSNGSVNGNDRIIELLESIKDELEILNGQ